MKKHRLINTFWNYRYIIVTFLLLIVILLIIYLLIQYKIISILWFQSHQYLFDISLTMLQILVILLGAILTYYRFFKGRTFSEKLIIKINIRVIKAKEKNNLHFLDINLYNSGSVLITNPIISIFIKKYKSKTEENESIALPFKYEDEACEKIRQFVIQPQESDSYSYLYKVSSDIWAVTYSIIVNSKGKIWKRNITIPNEISYEHIDN